MELSQETIKIQNELNNQLNLMKFCDEVNYKIKNDKPWGRFITDKEAILKYLISRLVISIYEDYDQGEIK